MKNTRSFVAAKTVGIALTAATAGLMATAGPAYAATAFTPEPMKKHHNHNHDHSGNSSQHPTQICGNNVGSNIVVGLGSKNQKAKSKNSGSCKQKTSSR
jgi:hypothetical protein